MNTTATYLSETWSRRCSTETVFSVQGKETDFVQDSSDTEMGSDADKDVEYEPVTESEGEAPISTDSSGETDNEVKTAWGGTDEAGYKGEELQLADSEAGSYVSDSELDLHAYWTCARCRSVNDNTRYRYCTKCFKVRKNFFPPRPRRKDKRSAATTDAPIVLSQDSGVDSHFSQEAKLSQDLAEGPSKETTTTDGSGLYGTLGALVRLALGRFFFNS
ncbi:hypothetical protein evm_013496 [Chilo suppressalis]|nr:hypothetical protein evm_013496 [Chilo suppressalis]